MAKPIYITAELIFNTADRLLAEGVPVIEITNNMIRKELKQGSPNDILKLLREWKEKQVSSKGLNVDIPDEFRDELSKCGSTLWSLAARISAEKVSHQYEDYHRIKRELEDTNASFSETDNELSELKGSISELYKQLLTLKEDVEGNKQALKVLQENNNTDKYMVMADEKLTIIKERIETIIDTHLNTDISVKSPAIEESSS